MLHFSVSTLIQFHIMSRRDRGNKQAACHAEQLADMSNLIYSPELTLQKVNSVTDFSMPPGSSNYVTRDINGPARLPWETGLVWALDFKKVESCTW